MQADARNVQGFAAIMVARLSSNWTRPLRNSAGQTRALRSGAAKCGAGHVVIIFTVDC